MSSIVYSVNGQLFPFEVGAKRYKESYLKDCDRTLQVLNKALILAKNAGDIEEVWRLENSLDGATANKRAIESWEIKRLTLLAQPPENSV